MVVKFLVVRFSSIGDIVLTTPVIRCLKTQVEGAEVHYLTKKKFEPVIKANPYVDKIYELDDNFKATKHYFLADPEELKKAMEKVKSQGKAKK